MKTCAHPWRSLGARIAVGLGWGFSLRETSMPSTSASGTWVQCFDMWGYQHAYINFTGAQNVSDLDDYKFTLFGSSSPGSAKVGDHIESLVTGPQTWLIAIDSFQMFSAQPADWPGASAARNGAITQLAIVEQKALFATISNDLESLVGALINLIPDIGGFLSSLMGIFWPSTTNPNLIWEAISGTSSRPFTSALSHR
ncbi:hypothetical protein MXAN_4922 [Myxococcus xanthus DK 1622]|uniref:Uncharacterized protein n=2 Tax=Myxococcaceae TaxID=31 RepID=Q1D2P5_MYXXD|nr:hypothetical protein MXAN_4922 [Myxococcus xanthus DK 1622]